MLVVFPDLFQSVIFLLNEINEVGEMGGVDTVRTEIGLETKERFGERDALRVVNGVFPGLTTRELCIVTWVDQKRVKEGGPSLLVLPNVKN